MYSFEPSEEQKMLIDAVARYSSGDLRLAAREAEEEARLKPDLVEKGWELGVLQASIPEAYGGYGDHSAVTGVLAAEELAWGDLAGALAVMTPGLFALPILVAGSEAQKQAYLPALVDAEWSPYTAALIEPRFDFDPNELNTQAIEDGEFYVLTGEKAYVPYAPEAKALLAYASLNGKTQGFIIPAGTQGFVPGDRMELLGIHALPVYRVNLDEVRVPRENRLGGEAGHEMGPILALSNVAMAGMALGLSRAAFEYSRDYSKEREVFGVKAAQKQAIAFMLAEMATEIEAIRLLTWEAAWAVDRGMEESYRLSTLAQVGAMDMAMMVTDRAVQILGGHGYIREHPVELWMRNGRGFAALNGLAIV